MSLEKKFINEAQRISNLHEVAAREEKWMGETLARFAQWMGSEGLPNVASSSAAEAQHKKHLSNLQ